MTIFFFFFRFCRSILAEHREKHGFDYWPKRNDPLRATVVPQLSKNNNKDEMNNNTLSRCRSLEFLENRKTTDMQLKQNGKENLHRSFDLLNNEEQHEVIIHHNQSMTDTETFKSNSMQHSTNTSESEQKSTSKQYALDFREQQLHGDTTHSTLSDAESLEDFTNKTKEIIQMKRASRQKFKERTMNELRERQKVENSFLKYPPNFSSTLASNSIEDLREYRTFNHYPNDFDDISVEMKNITKLLSASLIEPLESASTSSSFYQSTDKLAKRFTLYDKDNADDDDDDDEDDDDDHDDGGGVGDDYSSVKSDLEHHSNSYGNKTLNKNVTNGFFQNTCFENQSSSSCDTLKSVEIHRTNGKTITNGNGGNEDGEDDEESDTDLEEIVDNEPKIPENLQTFNHRAPKPSSLVSARIKSLLAKNMQTTTNKMPTVRSSLVANATNFKNSKLLCTPLKSSDPSKLPQQTSSNMPQNIVNSSTNYNSNANFMDGINFKEIGMGSTSPAFANASDNEAHITVHKATVHETHFDSNDERTNLNDN